ncbi:Hsp70 family chaperone [Hirsutella rhossiliensis]|uniref:Hsp70 family chaperone n=1 Tax=Hirsutella rhossiliensis TaxID=111463 RepID=A0A9P8MV19_9HYPO|nr:Hsp70 family chaperone [Hirsutella rhossiliensis]KAH0961780.1 Hsp70 family chaperone [Hirsutella rhossiliensis]
MTILVAVDFGATFSTVAFAFANANVVEIVTDWGSGRSEEHVPSVLKRSYGDSFNYGFQAHNNGRQGEPICEWFKLGLCPEVEGERAVKGPPLHQDVLPAALNPVKGRECKKLVTEYLKHLHGATENYLGKTYDSNICGLPREYIVTVPAMWSERARQATSDCAAKALQTDPNKIQIVVDSKAAGLCALANMPQVGLEEGDTFVICDAGGITVDLASYTIKALSPHIQLDKSSDPWGGLCGSVFLDMTFVHYIQKELDGYVPNWEDKKNQKWLNSMREQFETRIKKDFTGEGPDDQVYQMDAFERRDSSKHGIKDNILEISATAIREHVFDPVIREVTYLVHNYLDAVTGGVKVVLLAGGFGQNRYLKKSLQLALSYRVKVYEIEKSQTAINKPIEYGVPEKLALTFETDDSKVRRSAVIQCKVCGFNGDPPPFYPHTPRYPNPHIIPLATLKIKLDRNELAGMPDNDIDVDGIRRYKVDFDVHVTLSSAKMTFVLCRGEKKYEPKDVPLYPFGYYGPS